MKTHKQSELRNLFGLFFFASPQELSPHKQSTPTHLELGFISAFWARNWKQNRLFAFRETRVRVGKKTK